MSIQHLTGIHAAPSVVLRERENGPRGKSNGGFACGTFAESVGGTAKVSLAATVPLGVPLELRVQPDGVTVHHRGRPIATARSVPAFSLSPPVVPSWDEAVAAREAHPLRGVKHALSSCVVCGPERHDGLRVTPGPLASNPEILSSPFEPTEAYAADGAVRPAAVWGALDCPSYPASALREGRLCLLADMTAHVRRAIVPGERLVVVGWTISKGTRSYTTATALVDESGDVVGSARAVWVALKHQWLIRALSRLAP